MKRVMAIATAAAALFLSLQVGSAQQPSSLRFNATTANDLRTWDQFVTRAGASGRAARHAGRAGSLAAVANGRADAAVLPGRSGLGCRGRARFGRRRARVDLRRCVSAVRTWIRSPALTVEAARSRSFLSRRRRRTLLRPVDPVPCSGCRPESIAWRTRASWRVTNQVFRLFIDARSGAELLRYSSIQTQCVDRHRPRPRRRHEEDVRAAPGRCVSSPTIHCGHPC